MRDRLSVKNQMLIISNLEPGDYFLTLKKRGRRITIRVTDGEVVDRHVLGTSRRLEKRPGAPLQIVELKTDKEKIHVRLNKANEFTRVHVFVNRVEPRFDAYGFLSVVRDAAPFVQSVPDSRSLYIAGRAIGDEYQYILDRKYARKYPGNMLDRPELLLNPWAVRSTNTTREQLAQSEDFEAPMRNLRPSERRDNVAEAAQLHPTILRIWISCSTVRLRFSIYVRMKRESLSLIENCSLVITQLRSLPLIRLPPRPGARH